MCCRALAPFILLNIMKRSSPAFSRKKKYSISLKKYNNGAKGEASDPSSFFRLLSFGTMLHPQGAVVYVVGGKRHNSMLGKSVQEAYGGQLGLCLWRRNGVAAQWS
jgi:hypothetical protein